MSKRPPDNSGGGEEERIRRKIRRYEKKLARVRNEPVVPPLVPPQIPPNQPDVYDDGPDNNTYSQEIYDDLQEHPPNMVDETLNQGMLLPGQYEYSEVVGSQPPDLNYSEDLSSSSSGLSTIVSEAVEKEQTTAIDPVLLDALGDCHTDTPEWGQDILDDISKRWEPILKMGLKKESKEDLYKKYLFPKNVPSSKPPVLNPEISAVLTEPSRNRDLRVNAKQNQLGRVLTAIGRAMTGIINKSMETSEIVRTLNDAGRLLCDSHYLETDTRRSLITPLLDKSYITPFKDRKRDSFLFGENLGEFIKSSRGIKKTGELITPAIPSTNNLNYKGPQRQQQQQRGRTQNPGRGGGTQRAPPPAPRRSAPPPPPAPARVPRSAPRPPPHSSRRPQSAPSRSRNAT